MALRAVPDHPKFADLKERLGVPKYAALGILEAIWHFAGRFTPQGNIGKYPDSAIEAWIEWRGEPGAAVSALIDSKWLDVDTEHRILVHDWAHHADKATKQSLNRLKLAFHVPTVHTLGEQSVVLMPLPVPEPVPVPVPVAVAVNGGNGGTKNIDPIPLNTQSEYPLTIAEIRKHDPAVDEIFVLRLVQAGIQHCMSSSSFPQAKLPKLTDKVFARACKESFDTGPPTHRAGLLLNRVPPILVSWSVD